MAKDMRLFCLLVVDKNGNDIRMEFSDKNVLLQTRDELQKRGHFIVRCDAYGTVVYGSMGSALSDYF